jgi:ATP-binding cassette subfamily B protein
MIALLGESGCGKTTMLQILQRFYEPESGDIQINNDLAWKDLPVKTWRSHISSVPQQVKIFDGTLLDNISLQEVEEEQAEQIVAFCKNYGFNKYFEEFPQQYATILGEEGTNISGGQQQLVALARALYQEPDLLLLDEATSAMDRKTEQDMLQQLMKLKDQMGIILVTHRVKSVKLADQIYILDDGKIIEEGDPEQLAMGENLFSRSLEDLSV